MIIALLLPIFSTYAVERTNDMPLYNAVTYSFSGGRFGDNLLAYCHAKWVSYKYGIPLLYKPFEYSNKLKLHFSEKIHSRASASAYTKRFAIQTVKDIESALKECSLLELPYFTESEWERNNTKYYGKPWAYIPVDWEDTVFRQILRDAIQPIIPLEKVSIPKDSISVACHLRRGGGFDTEHTFRNASLKFPPDTFFISEIQELLRLFYGKKLYVFLFTDDKNPIGLRKKFEDVFQGFPVIFECRLTNNSHNLHVLDDFFAMIQFDCCLHGESNFSLCAGKIADYCYESQASSFHWDGDKLIIDSVTRKLRQEKIEERQNI